ncbi:uncharacterized protein B0P05DRAFT_545850 [Gilbertella persicaria]|uniref:uncharacterized protein n=1 Tax=Gilbertella persicaria TaxID=101096 RepID=UPI00221E814D|nr:uncharacterized protein B0P05DRAFT_545850 [Gilbertella persicaria]KAI8076431.1 hypothetical protein B0P05DRAFT_545850 [Gilbertella persicaria]
MSQFSDEQFEVQWSHSNSTAVLDPLSNDNESAILSSHSYMSDSSHVDIDISEQHQVFNDSSSSSSSNESFTEHKKQPIVLNKKVFVTDPRKETEQSSTFISYLVQSNRKQVRRRFQDFVWLHNVLYHHFPACFVPPLPDKHRLEYVKGDRFSSEFIEKRRISLERFTQRIARHPILGRADFFIMFLESSEFNDASARALREGQETMMDTIGDSLLNAFSKIRKPDPRFIEMKERSDRMEENLDMLQKTLLRTTKRTQDLSHDYEEFTVSVRELADIEPSFKPDLDCFAHGLEQYATSLGAMAAQDSQWQIEVHDYMAYYHAIKDVLKLRDQKQLDFEELSDYLQSTMDERAKTLREKPTGVTNYITGKLNEVRGADVDKIKREKVLRLDERVRELQEAIDQTHQVNTAFSDQVKKEDAFFNQNKQVEMLDALKTYTDAKVDFYRNVSELT